MENINAKARRGRKSKFKSLIIEKDFEPENPKQLEDLDENTCKWPIGHPNEEKFYFCGRKPEGEFPLPLVFVISRFEASDASSPVGRDGS